MAPREPPRPGSAHAVSRSSTSTRRPAPRIEVFYADRTLETFGRCGAGWFWWPRRRGFSPDGPATGPFPTSYAAYRHAMITTGATNRPLTIRELQSHRPYVELLEP